MAGRKELQRLRGWANTSTFQCHQTVETPELSVSCHRPFLHPHTPNPKPCQNSIHDDLAQHSSPPGLYLNGSIIHSVIQVRCQKVILDCSFSVILCLAFRAQDSWGLPSFQCHFFSFFFFFFCLFRAAPTAYGGSQARDQTGATN